MAARTLTPVKSAQHAAYYRTLGTRLRTADPGRAEDWDKPGVQDRDASYTGL